jgi:capsid protein
MSWSSTEYVGLSVEVEPPRQAKRQRLDASQATPIRARYDAAQTSAANEYHWASADSYDADSANSKAVRATLVKRSRYETNNNGYGKGIVLTHANYVVGRGPTLRMQTGSVGLNAMVEAAWGRWIRRVKFGRKLRTAFKAKVGDGEGFLVARTNPNLADTVKLDIVGIECDQFTTPWLPYAEPNRIDGIKFDDFGNPIFYDLLKYHPGGAWGSLMDAPEQIPARFVFHLFREDRSGQHRAVPELTATLGRFAQDRRYREAVVKAGENVANVNLLIKTGADPDDGPDQLTTFSTLPVQKDMMVALPGGGDAFQPRSEQPSATYDTFLRSQICEEARPLNMPYNIAACDSSGYSFSGGKLDHLTYFVGVDVDQSDIEDQCLDPLFDLWWPEAVRSYGWSLDQDRIPPHAWDWPARPDIDESKSASARETDLRTGSRSPSRVYADKGEDFEDEVVSMAQDYRKTPDEIREALFEKHLGAKIAPAASPQPDDEEDETPPGKQSKGNGSRFGGRLNRTTKSANSNGKAGQ